MDCQPEQKVNIDVAARHTLDLSREALGKIALVYDRSANELVLIGDLRPEFKEYLNTGDDTEQAILKGLNAVSVFLGEEGIQLHRKLPRPEGATSPVFGGAAVYFDGEKLFVNGTSVQFGPLHRGVIRECLKSLGREISFGHLVQDCEDFLTPTLERKINWEKRG